MTFFIGAGFMIEAFVVIIAHDNRRGIGVKAVTSFF
jgi:hypothetical protein